MARLDFFTGEGAVNSPAHIRPANNGSFPLIDAHDVQVGSNPTDADDRLQLRREIYGSTVAAPYGMQVIANTMKYRTVESIGEKGKR